MARIKIVTDSAQDFEPAYLESLGITVVPLTVHFGDVAYKDGFEMRGRKFYDLLRTSPHHPTTSQPSPGDFQKVFQELASDGSGVIAITLSSALSGTYQSAVLARENLPGCAIEVIDSKAASAGYGIMALLAREMAEQGRPFEEVVQAVRGMVENLVTLFSVDTLDYLARNGRIGRASHFLGTLLNMKPILGLDKDGYVTAVERVRGARRVIPRLVEIAVAKIPKGSPVILGLSHAEAEAEKEQLKNEIMSTFNVKRVFETEIGSIIGSHTGPGVLALFLLPWMGN